MKATFVHLFTPAAVVSCLALMGCAHDSPPPATPGVTQTTSSVVTTETRTTTAQAQPQGLGLSDDLIAKCKINFDNVDTAPKFDFDDATLSPDQRNVLDQVAKCVTTGPLKGQQLSLVGHADPRGEQEYNMELGSQRADSVKQYLIQDGVSDTVLSATSRGKMDATGTDEEGWAKDRRVDIDVK